MAIGSLGSLGDASLGGSAGGQAGASSGLPSWIKAVPTPTGPTMSVSLAGSAAVQSRATAPGVTQAVTLKGDASTRAQAAAPGVSSSASKKGDASTRQQAAAPGVSSSATLAGRPSASASLVAADCGPPPPGAANASGARRISTDPKIQAYWACMDSRPQPKAAAPTYGPGVDLGAAPPTPPMTTGPAQPTYEEPVYGVGVGGSSGPNGEGFGQSSQDLSRFYPESSTVQASALTKGGALPAVASSFGVSAEAPDWAWVAGGVAVLAGVGYFLLRKKKGRR